MLSIHTFSAHKWLENVSYMSKIVFRNIEIHKKWNFNKKNQEVLARCPVRQMPYVLQKSYVKLFMQMNSIIKKKNDFFFQSSSFVEVRKDEYCHDK